MCVACQSSVPACTMNAFGSLLGPMEQLEDYYGDLGCVPSSTAEQITTEYRKKVLLCHPDKRPNDEEAAREFDKLRTAYGVVGDVAQRARYDTWRASGLRISFKQWNRLSAAQQATHWRPKPREEPSITEGPPPEPKLGTEGNPPMTRDEYLRAFRQYKV
eukprot:comp23851_c0_seq5/m.41694 comp23851_c0_seq5/g.41694  ORF comp23851_c0_seq5/g.41694 comp23851_c0_seq5/m.41694 type:complete len:160 (-) comp23851_c0_seq5:261-740(-)